MFALLLILLESTPPDGLHLKRMCNGEPGTFAHAGCIYYISGFADGAQAATSHMHQIKRPLACMPRTENGEDLRRALLHSLEEHPERLRLPMNAAVLAAMAETYPCPTPP